MKNVNKMRITIPSMSKNERFARGVCASFALELDPTIEEISEIKTAISEAVTNCIIHGYDDKENGEIVIEGEINGREITYKVYDFGCGIGDIEKAREPLYTGKPDCERSGMGFSVMEAFTDELLVESEPGKGTVITMRKRIGENAD